MSSDNPRPGFCEDYHLAFLDRVRAAGVDNMAGCPRLLAETFEDELTLVQARAVFKFWRNDERRHGKKSGGPV